MTNDVKNVPGLRFPGFEDVWKEKNLGRVLDIKSGKAYKENEYTIKGVPLLQGENINHNKLKKPTVFLPDSYLNDNKNTILEKDDIVVGLNRPIIKNQLKIAKVSNEFIPGILYQRSGKIIYDKSKPDFYLNFFDKQIKEFVLKESVGSDQPFISTIQLKKKRVYIPVNENEIVLLNHFFSKLDRQIELEEQKLSLLEEQKKGYTQKIFSQELRFKDENGEHYPNWKKITIKEVANLTAGKSKKNENTGKYIIMDMGTVTKNGTILTHKSTPYESDLLNKGDLVMPKDDIGGGHIIGKTAFIPDSHKYVLGDHVYRLEIKKCSSLFLHYYINSDIVNRSLKRKVTGSAQLGLNRKSVEEEVIKTPCLEEQEKIGILFNKIDNLIELQTNKIEQLKQRKQGLLQKMFI